MWRLLGLLATSQPADRCRQEDVLSLAVAGRRRHRLRLMHARLVEYDTFRLNMPQGFCQPTACTIQLPCVCVYAQWFASSIYAAAKEIKELDVHMLRTEKETSKVFHAYFFKPIKVRAQGPAGARRGRRSNRGGGCP
jgi:hypothetical protein